MPQAGQEVKTNVSAPGLNACKSDVVEDPTGLPCSPTEASEANIGNEAHVAQDAISTKTATLEKRNEESLTVLESKTGSKDGKKRRAPPLPKNARSLSDEQYAEIFEAVLHLVLLEDAAEDNDNEIIKEDEAEEREGEKEEREEENVEEEQADIAEDNQEENEDGRPEAQIVNETTPLCDDDDQIKKKIAKAPPKVPPKKSLKPPKKNKLPPINLGLAPKKAVKEIPKPVKAKKRELDAQEGKHRIDEPKKKRTKTSKEEAEEKKSMMANREVEEEGIWVQCSIKSCEKWRVLKDVYDPSLLPDVWTCSMNTDPDQNTCDAREAEFNPDTEHEDFLYTTYADGSLVWARMPGYPWWPGMVEVDPDYQVHFECRSKPNKASHYHVVFLDENVSRTWLSTKNIKTFNGEQNVGSTYSKGKNYKKQIGVAREIACEALDLSLPDRIKCYGFASRFKGNWGKLPKETEISGSPVHSPKMKKSKSKKSRESAGVLCGLSTEEVDEILDNAESLIESANEALNELLSQSSGDEYALPDSPVKPKKRKKERTEKPASAEGKKKKKEKGAEKGTKGKAVKSTKDSSNEKKKPPQSSAGLSTIKKGSPPSSSFTVKPKAPSKPMIPPKKNKAARPKENDKEIEDKSSEKVSTVVKKSEIPDKSKAEDKSQPKKKFVAPVFCKPTKKVTDSKTEKEKTKESSPTKVCEKSEKLAEETSEKEDTAPSLSVTESEKVEKVENDGKCEEEEKTKEGEDMSVDKETKEEEKEELEEEEKEKVKEEEEKWGIEGEEEDGLELNLDSVIDQACQSPSSQDDMEDDANSQAMDLHQDDHMEDDANSQAMDLHQDEERENENISHDFLSRNVVTASPDQLDLDFDFEE